MTTDALQIQLYYEIAMAIGNHHALQDMLKEAVPTYLQKLGCKAGLVFLDEQENAVFAVPRQRLMEKKASYQMALKHKHQTGIPIHCEEDQTYFHWFDLGSIGQLLLFKAKTPLSLAVCQSLLPINKKLSIAIKACLQNEKIQTLVQELYEKNNQLHSSEEELRQGSEELLTTNELLNAQKQKVENALKKLEEAKNQMVQSEKMASLGQLTAGVAHEINNPINFISGGTQSLYLIMDDIADLLDLYTEWEQASDKEHKESCIKKIQTLEKTNGTKEELKEDALAILSDIQKGTDRVTEIIQGLRNFSRTDNEQKKLGDLHENINNTLLILHNKYKDRVEITKKFDPDIKPFKCYPGQLSQVFMNIISNAIDAIKEKGHITIATQQSANTTRISIKDTGTGIPEDIKNKIFDPFFTTKDVGKGTGLGLSIVYGIIDKHQGEISLTSELGEGTEFIIEIPSKASAKA